MRLWFLLALLPLAILADTFPDHILQSLRKSLTIADVIKNVGLVGVKQHPDEDDLSSSEEGSDLRVASLKIQGQELIDQEDVRARNFVNMLDSKPVANHCTLKKTCVSVPPPVARSQVDLYRFPKCVMMNQCVGTCCFHGVKCVPRAIRRMPHTVGDVTWNAKVNKTQLVDITEIKLEEHLSCGCFQCPTENPPVCLRGEFLDDNCTCVNTMEKQEAATTEQPSCPADFTISDFGCQCEKDKKEEENE